MFCSAELTCPEVCFDLYNLHQSKPRNSGDQIKDRAKLGGSVSLWHFVLTCWFQKGGFASSRAAGALRRRKRPLTRAWRAARVARSGISPRDVACQWESARGRWGRGGVGLQEQRRTESEETSKRARNFKGRQRSGENFRATPALFWNILALSNGRSGINK